MRYLLLSFFISFIANAYSPKDIDITKFEYVRYVKPQLRSIVLSYKTLLIGLTPEIQKISKAFDLQFDLYTFERDITDTCIQKSGSNCKIQIDSLSATLQELIKVIDIEINYSEINNLTLGEKLKAQNTRSQLKLQIIQTLEKIQDVHLKMTLAITKQVSTLGLKKELLQVISKLDSFLLFLSDNRFRSDLTDFQTSFITPVTKYILLRDNQQVFIQNIDEFNIRLNAIVMRITKYNYPVDKKVKTLINIIHNRWNNILKVSLITN
jgi:hypothetical protein